MNFFAGQCPPVGSLVVQRELSRQCASTTQWGIGFVMLIISDSSMSHSSSLVFMKRNEAAQPL